MIVTNNGILKSKDSSFLRDEEPCLEISVIRSKAGLGNLKNEWVKLIARSNAHVFQTIEWIQNWWKHFGGDHELHIVTLRREDTLIGIAPFFIEIEKIFGVKEYRTLRFLGDRLPVGNNDPTFNNYSPSDYLGIISDFNCEEEVAEALFKYLSIIKNDCHFFEFNELPENGLFMQKIYPRIAESDWVFQSQKMEICPFIQLPASIDEYMGSLTSKERYNIKHAKRAVTDKKLFEIKSVTSSKELEDAFESFIALHKQRWEQKGMPGIFTTGKYQAFLEDVLWSFFTKGYLNIMTAADKKENCFAVDLTFEFNSRIYGYQKGFDANSEFAKYSPGRSLTYFILCRAIANDRETYEMLRGSESYKMRWATTSVQNWCIKCYNSSRMVFWDKLYQLSKSMRIMKERLAKEMLTISVHAKNYGVKSFCTKYLSLVISRIQNKLQQ